MRIVIRNVQEPIRKRSHPLTREPHQLIPSVSTHILLIGMAHRVDEKSRRIHPITALI